MDSTVMEIEVEIVTEEEIIIPKTVCSTLRRKTYKSPTTERWGMAGTTGMIVPPALQPNQKIPQQSS